MALRAYVTSGGPLVTTRAGPGRLAQRAGQRVRAAHGAAAHNRRQAAPITIDAADARGRMATAIPMRRPPTARRKAGCGRARKAHFYGDAVLPQRDFDLTSGPQRPAGFQRQDGIRRRSLGKGRRVRSVKPAWRGQRTATNQTGAPPAMDGMGALSPRATVAVQRKSDTSICGFSNAWYERSQRTAL